MTTSKNGIRRIVDEVLSDFGVDDRFEYDISKSCMKFSHVDGKTRVPHPDNAKLCADGDNQIDLNAN